MPLEGSSENDGYFMRHTENDCLYMNLVNVLMPENCKLFLHCSSRSAHNIATALQCFLYLWKCAFNEENVTVLTDSIIGL